MLFCENETNSERLYGTPSATATPKDGINDHVVSGADTVATDRGTKAAFRYRLDVGPGETAIVRVRLRRTHRRGSPWADFDEIAAEREREADEFYGDLTPAEASADEALVLRQALAGMLWSKQLYAYDVARWLDGDPGQPTPPESRLHGRNSNWRTFDAFDLMSMPDKWEYPWFAAWDLAFHCVALARVDPAFAKYQLILLCREWFQHPNGALPAYEWAFDDVNPPVQAWAVLEVFAIDGARDLDFLGRVFDKLLVNFTWWVNRQDRDGSNVFEGGFLGLDNIGPLDRSHIPADWLLEQSDGTGWMGFYALSMAAIASILQNRGRPAADLVLKFVEHFALISTAFETQSLWNEDDGFFYDRLRLPDGSEHPIGVRSIVGVLPLLGVAAIDEEIVDRAETINKRGGELLRGAHPTAGGPGNRRVLLGVVGVSRMLRLLTRLFDESEFLSPYGLRAVSKELGEHPFVLDVPGMHSSIDYEPAESTTGMFGGNSNWRGPVWMPVNFLVVEALNRYARFFGDELKLRVSDRLRLRAHAGRDRERSTRALDLPLPRRRGRASAVLRLGRPPAGGPGVEGQRPLQRVLPRRQRSRARREPPDRLDGPRRRADPPRARRAGADARRAHVAAPRPLMAIRFGPQTCGSLDVAAAREWLVADGVGGYAMGTVAGLRTRRYHGLLVVAVDGPAHRMLGLAALDPVLVLGDGRVRLATDEWGGGTVDPAGNDLLAAFELTDGVPRWRWQIGGIVLERELAAAHGSAVVGVVHRLVAADRDVVARADAALHLARRARRTARERCAGGRGRRARLRVRGRVSRRRRRLAGGRRVVPGRPGARGGGARPRRPGGSLGGRRLPCGASPRRGP